MGNMLKLDSGRKMAAKRKLPEIARLVHALRKEGVRFQVVGMSAAILQGVPAATIDTDLWVDLPTRRFVELNAIIQKLGGCMLAPTAAALADDTIINFLPHLDGLQSFDTELKRCEQLSWHGTNIPVFPLRRILKSKQTIRRPKHLAHIPLLKQAIALQRNL